MDRFGGWFFYFSGQEDKLVPEKCGKWMYFFKADEQEFAQDICQKAIDEKICYNCKCTDIEADGRDTGVICFYANDDDYENHKRIISFMLKNDLIPKTRHGKYWNISFKFDQQTIAGEYGDGYDGKLKLEQLMNLYTGEWL